MADNVAWLRVRVAPHYRDPLLASVKIACDDHGGGFMSVARIIDLRDEAGRPWVPPPPVFFRMTSG